MKIIKSNYKLEIKSRINFYFIQCFGFLISTLYIFFYLIKTTLSKELQAFNINYLVYFCLFIFFGLLSIWFIFGYEKIIIDIKKENIQIVKSNYLFTHTKLVSLNKIKRIECHSYKNSFFDNYCDYIKESQRSFFWINMGKIKIYTGINTISILNGLSKLDCRIAFDEINIMMNKSFTVL